MTTESARFLKLYKGKIVKLFVSQNKDKPVDLLATIIDVFDFKTGLFIAVKFEDEIELSDLIDYDNSIKQDCSIFTLINFKDIEEIDFDQVIHDEFVRKLEELDEVKD